MTLSQFFSVLAMVVATAIALGFGSAYLEIRQRDQMAAELAQWQLEEWKDNLLEERHREFLGRSEQ